MKEGISNPLKELTNRVEKFLNERLSVQSVDSPTDLNPHLRLALELLTQLNTTMLSSPTEPSSGDTKRTPLELTLSQTSSIQTLVEWTLHYGLHPHLLPGNHPYSTPKEFRRHLPKLAVRVTSPNFEDEIMEGGSLRWNSKWLVYVTWRLIKLTTIFSPSPTTTTTQTWLSALLIKKYSRFFYAACLQIGYGPTERDTPGSTYRIQPKDQSQFRTYSVGLVNKLDKFQTLHDLFSLMGRATSPHLTVSPTWLIRRIGSILSGMLIQQSGVRRLLSYFADQDMEERGLTGEQLQRIAQLILTCPSELPQKQDYYRNVTQQLLSIIRDPPGSESCHPTIATTVTYTLNRFFQLHPEWGKTLVIDSVMSPFRQYWVSPPESDLLIGSSHVIVDSPDMMGASYALHALACHGNPSLEFLQMLVAPYLEPLFELYTTATKGGNSEWSQRVVEVLASYLSLLPDRVKAAKELLKILETSMGMGSSPNYFVIHGSQSSLHKRSKNGLGKYQIQENLSQVDVNSFVRLSDDLVKRGVTTRMDLFICLLEGQHRVSTQSQQPDRVLIWSHVIMVLLEQHGDRLAAGSSLESLPLLMELVQNFTISSPINHPEPSDPLESSSESQNLTRLLLEILNATLEAHLNALQPDHFIKLVSLRPTITTFLNSPTLTLSDKRQCHSLLLLIDAGSVPSSAGTPPHAHGNPLSISHIRTKFQHAQLLLKDDLIPVRASGVRMLLELVEGRAGDQLRSLPIPLRETLLEALAEEDPYIHLPAIRGLVGWVVEDTTFFLDCYVNYSTDPLLSPLPTQADPLPFQLKIGEVLLLALRCHPTTLADPILGVTLAALRTGPEPLQTSALSLLSSLLESNPAHLLPHLPLLLTTISTLLRLASPPLLRPALLLLHTLLAGVGPVLPTLLTPTQLTQLQTDLEAVHHRATSLDLISTRHAQVTLDLLHHLLTPSSPLSPPTTTTTTSFLHLTPTTIPSAFILPTTTTTSLSSPTTATITDPTRQLAVDLTLPDLSSLHL